MKRLDFIEQLKDKSKPEKIENDRFDGAGPSELIRVEVDLCVRF